MSNKKNFCPECGVEIPTGAPAGQCPKCMMKAGFESEGPGSMGFEPPSVEALRELFPQLEILQLVGTGGMGAVFKARQPSLDRFVAIKVLPLDVGRDPAFADRFTREARAMARLNHPNIVAIYDFGQTEGLFYFVMEYIDGANLRQTIQAGKLKPEVALAIVPQICDALQFAHDEGIVHRDIKPENVLIGTRGRVKIADFGLAKLLGEEQIQDALTHTNQVMGTLRYMAPEQMQGTHDVDHRADIYSLGVVFYELLTGDVPMGHFEPPSRKVEIDVRLDEVVLRALAQEPDKRYQHASEVKTDVELLASEPAPAVARKPAPDDTLAFKVVDVDLARREVKSPAMGLVAVGVLTCLTAGVPVALAVKTLHDLYDGRITLESNDRPQRAIPAPATAPASERGASPDGLGSPSAEGLREVAAEAPPPGRTEGGLRKRGLSLAGLLRYAALFVLVLLLPTLGIIITWGGWAMMHMQSRGLAMTASILALLPCQPAFILGPIFGIWSLMVLNRRHVITAFKDTQGLPPLKLGLDADEKTAGDSTYISTGVAIGIALGTAIGAAMDDMGVGIALGIALGAAFGAALSSAKPKDAGDSRSPQAKPDANFVSRVRSQLRVPAIGLMGVGVLNLLATLMVLLIPVLVRRAGGFDEGAGFVEGASTFDEAMFLSMIIAICSLVSGIMLILGAARMLDLQSHPLALLASVVALLPVAIGFPISLPLGIWGLLVLSRQDVKDSFADGAVRR